MKQAGVFDLEDRLHCKENPKDWLLIKLLCKQTTESLGGVPLLRLSSDTLLKFKPPASNILVIENEQSCLTLNNIANTIAVSGGGKSVSWMRAEWLSAEAVLGSRLLLLFLSPCLRTNFQDQLFFF